MSAKLRVHDLIDLEPAPADLAAEVIDGLGSDPKTLPCKLLYDKRGSELFEQICEVPEYYPTRTEIEILRQYQREIVAAVGPRVELVELGSGSSVKTQILLDALEAPVSYVPIDISRQHLWESAERVSAAYPKLRVQPVCADYLEPLKLPDSGPGTERRVAFFPGSTIGNFEEPEARIFLDRIADIVGAGGGLLIGVDLRKAPDVLVAAYDDAAGVTAEFSLNLLHRLNREVNADFDVDQFRHRSVWNDDMGRIEISLVSCTRQSVGIHGHAFEFEAGEPILTEYAYKYRLSEFAELATRFDVRCVWTDERAMFSVQYLEVLDARAAGRGTAAAEVATAS